MLNLLTKGMNERRRRRSQKTHTHTHTKCKHIKMKIKCIPKFCDVTRSEICEEKKKQIKTKMQQIVFSIDSNKDRERDDESERDQAAVKHSI